jgi:1,4-alpha-glucan branching enzyme
MATTTSKKTAQTSSKKIPFEFYAPDAKKVCVVGSFNKWSTEAAPLKKDRSGRWTTALELTPGRYEYRYVVDGSWQNDQRPVATVANPYGSRNSIVEV